LAFPTIPEPVKLAHRQNVKPLETACEWRADDVKDPASWTEMLNAAEIDEIAMALRVAQKRSANLLDITRDDFPLPQLSARLKSINYGLLNGRGFVLLRGISPERFSRDEMTWIFWGIGRHLGKPWPQNRHGHLLGDVTDQGKSIDDPTARGNELGEVRLDYHSDAADLVGLLCLCPAATGGLSTVANAVTIHNELVNSHPELAAELYLPQPFDYRGEEEPGTPGWYPMPVFTEWNERLFVRFIRPYILEAERHPGAPKVTQAAKDGLALIESMAETGRYSVFMPFEAGDMQFVNNYHVLHARHAYTDRRDEGKVRHLKRLWLETDVIADADKPERFRLGRGADNWWSSKGRTKSEL